MGSLSSRSSEPQQLWGLRQGYTKKFAKVLWIILFPAVSYYMFCYQNFAFPGCILHCSFALQTRWPFAAVMKMGKTANLTRLFCPHLIGFYQATHGWALGISLGRDQHLQQVLPLQIWPQKAGGASFPTSLTVRVGKGIIAAPESQSLTEIFSDCQLKSKEDFKNAVGGHSVFIYYTSHSTWQRTKKASFPSNKSCCTCCLFICKYGFYPSRNGLREGYS